MVHVREKCGMLVQSYFESFEERLLMVRCVLRLWLTW